MFVECLPVPVYDCAYFYFTGTFFILGALLAWIWNWAATVWAVRLEINGNITIIGAIALSAIPEFAFGRYRRNRHDES